MAEMTFLEAWLWACHDTLGKPSEDLLSGVPVLGTENGQLVPGAHDDVVHHVVPGESVHFDHKVDQGESERAARDCNASIRCHDNSP
jgi:hypothetical protein